MLNLIISSLSLIFATIFIKMSHPLAMGLMLLLQTATICLLTGFMTQSYWFSYILFLVFLGGLLVLFIYVTSLASNEMFSFSSYSLLSTLTPLLILITFIVLTDPMPWLNNIMNSEILPTSIYLIEQEEASSSLIKLYNQPTSMITLILVLYLFLTLIAVVKITSIFQGPLRQKN
uniref:NADH-ubiquinone oxidoreductase chain 6 n=1 Tax=Soliperla sp. ZTC-2018 TaxID=2267274 RepID=A0A344KZ58_9NEOP|nr:NADH dehydrogenase subunit 6 [Soliperla sp. ZTC-2018]AXB38840.1 NADH dehydrogenase subunit 6 [Soliperla sp. ZTC-2018]